MIKLDSPTIEAGAKRLVKLLYSYERLKYGKLRHISRVTINNTYLLRDFWFSENSGERCFNDGVKLYVKRRFFWKSIMIYKQWKRPRIRCDIKQIGHLRFALSDLESMIQDRQAYNEDVEAVLEETMKEAGL